MQKAWAIFVKECIFDKVGATQASALSENWNPLQVSFNWFVYILG